MRLLLSPLILAPLLLCLRSAEAQGRAPVAQASPPPGQTGRCSRTQPVHVSQDSIGLLRLDKPLEELKRICAAAYDTTIACPWTYEGPCPPHPGLAFPFDSVLVVGRQIAAERESARYPREGSEGRATLDISRGADGWFVIGSGATLPGGVPISAPWAQLHRQYGTAQANMSGGVLWVIFCSLPRILITMNLQGGSILREGDRDLKAIPPQTTIHHLFIFSQALADRFLPCK